MNAEYNPLAPFSKGEFLKSPLIKGDLGGCHTHARELLQINKTQNTIQIIQIQSSQCLQQTILFP